MKNLYRESLAKAPHIRVRGFFLFASMLLVLCAATTAQAHDGPQREGGPGRHAPGMQGPGGPHHPFPGDFRRFGPDDRALWAGGGWRHDYYDGRWGWWWIVDGMWYWYDQPIYPYPTVVSSVIYAPPPVPVADATPAPATPVAPAPRFRYYCPDQGYYPEVQTCPTDFVRQPIP